jgi:hypothetical protein
MSGSCCQERTLAQNNKSLACNNKTSADCPVKAAAAMSNSDYYVVTSKRGEYPDRWSWEIRRRSKPLGVKLMAHGFQSDSAAQVAGKRASQKKSGDEPEQMSSGLPSSLCAEDHAARQSR